MFSMIYAWTNGWVNNQYADDFRRHRAHYDVTVMWGGNDIWKTSDFFCQLCHGLEVFGSGYGLCYISLQLPCCEQYRVKNIEQEGIWSTLYRSMLYLAFCSIESYVIYEGVDDNCRIQYSFVMQYATSWGSFMWNYIFFNLHFFGFSSPSEANVNECHTSWIHFISVCFCCCYCCFVKYSTCTSYP